MLQEAESAKQILKNISYDELIVDGKEQGQEEQASSGALDDLLQEQTESLETANTEITEHLDTLFDETSEIQTLDYDDTFSDIEPIENEISLEEEKRFGELCNMAFNFARNNEYENLKIIKHF